MDVAAKRARYREVREKALAITDRAIADDRQLTESEMKQLEELVKEGKQLSNEMEGTKLGASPELLEQIKSFAARPGVTESHVPEQLKDGEVVLGLKDDTQPHPWAVTLEEYGKAHGQKTFTMPTGSVPMTSLATTPFSIGQLPANVVAAIGLRTWPAVGGRSLNYLRQTTRSNNAAIWTSGTKPVSDFVTALVQADATTIAHLAAPINVQDLADFAGLNQWVQSELLYGISRALESAVVNATGPEPALTGLTKLAGTTPVAAGSDAPSTLMAATVALETAGYPGPYTAIMSPADWSALALMKASGSGEYQYPTLPAAGAAPSILGISVVTTPAIAAKTVVVANLRASVQLYEREPANCVWGTTSATSGGVAANFEKNQIACRAEGRFAMAVPQPGSIAIATLP